MDKDERSTACTRGIDHVAVLTHDLDRMIRFYAGLFGARRVEDLEPDGPARRHCLVDVGDQSMLHLMEVPDIEIPTGPMFGRGRIDHLALSAADEASLYLIRDRLVDAGASDGHISDFGFVLSIYFRDPDGMEAEVTWTKDRRANRAEPIQGG